MSTPFMGEMRIMSFGFPPKGWALCNGQLLPINQNQALFSILGTTYGGDGRVNFALPNMQGRTPIHVGQGFIEGQAGGEFNHTLTISETPAHNHFVSATSDNGDAPIPTGNMLGGANNLYGGVNNLTTLSPDTITNVGGSQPHSNQQPFLVLSMCIALQGIFPSQN
jgi:microcystin-dependent protein